ncbi:hypothetical protein B0H11DRAFT_1962643, partial [Mycena galericulata]
MYSARIEGRQSDMTVAVYQGENAEEKWKRELAKYSGIRHPNFVQPFGIVSSSGLYATVYHDELVPVREYIEEYGLSMLSIVYLYVYFVRPLAFLLPALNFTRVGSLKYQVNKSSHFCCSIFLPGCNTLYRASRRKSGLSVTVLLESATWIRRSVGRLCVELSNT